ncbi:MAG: hypothetical protein ACJA08_002534 [Cyclobacteriaceae bacterium]
MERVFVLLAFILATWSSNGQNLYYEYIRGDHKIGSLEATRTVEDSLETFTLRNLVEFRVIFSFTVEYALTETFKNGALISGEGFNTMNGVSQRETHIRLKEEGYHLKIDGVEAHNEKKSIVESMSRIYYEELYDGKEVYSQYFGLYLTAEQTGDHKYVIESADGENVYKYEYGYCTEVKVVRDFATFYIRMLPESRETIEKFAKGLD